MMELYDNNAILESDNKILTITISPGCILK